MSKKKPARVTPKIAGSQVYNNNGMPAQPGNFIFKHSQKYHVFVGMTKVLVTPDIQTAYAEAAKVRTTETEAAGK